MALLDINNYIEYLQKTPYEVEQMLESQLQLIPEEIISEVLEVLALALVMQKMTQLQRGLLYYNEHKMLVRVGFKTYPIHSLSKEVKNFAVGRLVEGYIIEEEFLINR